MANKGKHVYKKLSISEEYANTTVSFSLTSSERIAIVEGDMLAWYVVNKRLEQVIILYLPDRDNWN